MTDNERFPAVFDFEAYCRKRQGEIRPRPPFAIPRDEPGNARFVAERLHVLAESVLRAPNGAIADPYIVPGGPYNELWDWDAFFAGLGIGAQHPSHFRGSILAFLAHITEDGMPPCQVRPSGPAYGSLALPLQAQWCAIAGRFTQDYSWLAPWWETLKRCRQWFETACEARRGLFRLAKWPGHGLDNDPVIYGRRSDTVGAVHVNCYHYREYRAMAVIAQALGHADEARQYAQHAAELRDAINTYMWDPIDGCYYHLDLSDFEDVRAQEITWELPYKVRSAACLWPLWAGVATPEQAERLVREHVLNPEEFLSDFGIRSLAKNERIYNNLPMGNPSNWQGPVWGVTTFTVAYGLARYGYRQQAIDVAARLVDTFAGDLRANGVLHEYYHADTGVPVIKPGFLSWNLMACRVAADLQQGADPAEIDLPLPTPADT